MNGVDTAGPVKDAIEDAVVRSFELRHAVLERQRRRSFFLWAAGTLLVFAVAAWWTGFSPVRVAEGLPRFGEYVGRLFTVRVDGQQVPVLAIAQLLANQDTPQSIAYWFYRIDVYLTLIWQTIQMAVIATLMGFTVAFALSFPASRNLVAARGLVFTCRRLLEFMRSVPDLVFALIFVWCFGIGPLAGILAIGIHSAGALGKLFSELNENADRRPIEGIRAAGGSWLEIMRYGVVPQVLPGFLSYTLFRFEINIRAATVIGFVGAGGIGTEVYHVIVFNKYDQVSAMVLLVLIVVMLIDLLSEHVRHRFIGGVDAGARR